MKPPDSVPVKKAALARSHSRKQTLLALAVLSPVVLLGIAAATYPVDPIEAPLIRYRASTPTDIVAQLQKRLERGEIHLSYTPDKGYLPAVLSALKVSPASQTLVFSKTSVQYPFISPRHPRALYYNDQVYVGWVDGGAFLEISAVDPKLGSVFYVLEQRTDVPPRFLRRNDECLMCHSIRATGNVPGHIMRSVMPHVDGTFSNAAENSLTTDKSKFSDRWGGWYVTGTHGTARHRGNQVARAESFDAERGANVTKLTRYLDTQRYLTPHSDIVALLIMEHQTTVQNRITQANYATRRGLAGAVPNAVLPEEARDACDDLLRALLFSGTAPLPASVKGTSKFTAEFQKRGPFDRQGRSLRQLDLKTRVFRYRCSYLIYSEAVNALPPAAKQYLYRGLGQVLRSENDNSISSGLSAAERDVLRQILSDTKPDLAPYLASGKVADRNDRITPEGKKKAR